MSLLEGCVAMVTGSPRRLGAHLARTLAKSGADVILHYNKSEAEVARLESEITALGRRTWVMAADFTEPEGAASLMARVKATTGKLDVLVNNVGNYLIKPLVETTAADWRAILDANLIAPHVLIREAIEVFPERGGAIINMGYAGVESLRPSTRTTAYQVSKTGLFVLTKSYAKLLAPRRIRVNMISPGQLENSVDLPKDVERVIPIGRAGRLEDVAHAMMYLLSPESYVTGINIDVAGGYRL